MKINEDLLPVRNIITVGKSTSVTQPSGNTKVVYDKIYSQIGDKLSLKDGNIIIGKDIKKILISATVRFGWSAATKKNFSVYKNSELLYEGSANPVSAHTLTLASLLTDVKEGDIISVKVDLPSTLTDGDRILPYQGNILTVIVES